jgi:hypothetical protein
VGQFILAQLMGPTPFPKRLRKLQRLEDRATAVLDAAYGRSNVYSIASARRGERLDQMDAERLYRCSLALATLEAIAAERKHLARLGIASPGYPVPRR